MHKILIYFNQRKDSNTVMDLKIAIVDTPSSNLDTLINHIHHYQKDFLTDIHLCTYYSSKEFLSSFKKNAYHLIFLNLDMENEIGIEIAQSIRKTDIHVRLILTSDSDKYALSGYRVHAYDYLVMPCFYNTVQQILEETSVFYNLKVPYITVKENRCNINIKLDDILYVDVDNHYLQIHTANRVIRTYMRFRDFEPLLSNYPQFLCCYRNVLVNMDHIILTQDMDFKMDNGNFVPIRRNAKQEMRQKYADYQFVKSIAKHA